MNIKTRARKGFTLIELLVVVLILGILTAVALPAYLGSIKDARLKTANSNAKTIATAVQAVYTKLSGSAYTGLDATNTAVLSELNGTIPDNSCSATAGAGGWTIVAGSSTWSIAPASSANCASAPTTISLGG